MKELWKIYSTKNIYILIIYIYTDSATLPIEIDVTTTCVHILQCVTQPRYTTAASQDGPRAKLATLKSVHLNSNDHGTYLQANIHTLLRLFLM